MGRTELSMINSEQRRRERMLVDSEYALKVRAYRRAAMQKWRAANREKEQLRQHKWRLANPKEQAACSRAWRIANKGEKNALTAARKAAVARRTPAWSNLDAVKLVYLVCEQRTRLTGIAHHVDHFYPLNGKSISGLHVPLNLRVIPATENLRKGARLLAA